MRPEYSYNRIQQYINECQRSPEFGSGKATIRIDLDNQDYIISLLEACAQTYSQYSDDEHCKKAEWFNNAVIDARRKKEQYAKKLEEAKTANANNIMKSMLCLGVCGLAFAICLFVDMNGLIKVALVIGAVVLGYFIMK